MANINIELSDHLLIKVLASATAKKIGLDAYLEEILAEAEAEADEEDLHGFTDIDSAIAVALQRATALAAGKDFHLQDLFSEPEWASVASPRWVGRKFRPAVETAGLAKHIDKTDTNKAIYRRL